MKDRNSDGTGTTGMFSKKDFVRQELGKRRNLLYQIAYSWTHNRSLAEDLVQETMVKALRHAGQLKTPAAVKGWLGKILANCWYDYLRQKKETVDLENLPYEEFEAHGDSHEKQDLIGRVRAMIAELPVGQRQVITLVDLAGFSYVEIADILDIPIGTVMSRISRARKTLKMKLADYDPRHEITRAKIRRVK